MSVRDSKRYFWLKLKDDFFDDDAIEWLEEQPNGKEYVLFYLKLCLKSLKHDCCLIRTVGNMLIPYDAKKLGELTRTKEDTVIVALELLKRIGLVDIQENGALYMAKVSEMIGSETNAAARMRKSREKAKELDGVNNVRPMLQNCSPELEKELEKELESREGDTQTDELQPLIDFYQANIEILTPFKLQDIQGMYEDFGSEWLQKAMEKVASCEQGKRNNKYLRGVLKGWQKDGVPKPWESDKSNTAETDIYQLSGAEFMAEQARRREEQEKRDDMLAAIARAQRNG